MLHLNILIKKVAQPDALLRKRDLLTSGIWCTKNCTELQAEHQLTQSNKSIIWVTSYIISHNQQMVMPEFLSLQI